MGKSGLYYHIETARYSLPHLVPTQDSRGDNSLSPLYNVIVILLVMDCIIK